MYQSILKLIIVVQVKNVLSNSIQPHLHGYNITPRLVKTAVINEHLIDVPNRSNAENNDVAKNINNKNKNVNQEETVDKEVNLTNNYEDIINNKALNAITNDNSRLEIMSKGNEYVYNEMDDTDAIAYRMKDGVLNLLISFMNLIRNHASKKNSNEIESTNQDLENANSKKKIANEMAVNNTKNSLTNKTITTKNNESKIHDPTKKFPILPIGIRNNTADVNNVTDRAISMNDNNKTLEQDKQQVIKNSNSEPVNVNLSANDTDKPTVVQNNLTDSTHTPVSDNIIGNVINSTPNRVENIKNGVQKLNGVRNKIKTIAAIVKEVVKKKINDYFNIQSFETRQGENDAGVEIDSSSMKLRLQKPEVTLREFSLVYAL